MFKVIDRNSQDLTDADEFIELLNQLPAELDNFFADGSDIFVTRAPGRLDVMGGIADYSGSLMLELPIREATFAAVQKSDDEKICVVSFEPTSNEYLEFEVSLHELHGVEDPHYYRKAKDLFHHDRSNIWASYVAGVFFVLLRERGVTFENGAKILIASKIPLGKGVSSSAALEVATMRAVCLAFGLELNARDIALLCQKVENNIVGAACGIMDQISVNCGVENSLLSILCQPAEILGTIDIPDRIQFWGIDSGVRHSVAGASYSSVRIAAFMGYRIIADAAGFESRQIGEGQVAINDDRWRGYLANLSPTEYEREFACKLPENISGREFLGRYRGTTDAVSAIEPSIEYRVRAAAEHAIYESSRVKRFAEVLTETITRESLQALGKLMFESHESYSACGLTEPRTDRIVELVRNDASGYLVGARITGGGSGGTVVVLATQDSKKTIEGLLKRLEDDSGEMPYLFYGSSPGADAFGHVRLTSIRESISPIS